MNRRLQLAKLLMRAGVTRVSHLFNHHSLYIFSYHRVKSDHEGANTLFDSAVFGLDLMQLKEQITFLKKHTTILGEQDLIDILAGKKITNGPCSMITFDDAYADNYHLALPLLIEYDVPAIFFIPTTSIETRMLGWWDQIAFIVKNSSKPEIRLDDEVIILENRKQAVIDHLHRRMKLEPAERTSGLINKLAIAADSPPPATELMDRELMTWEQIQAVDRAGITLGSHTCSHRVLATLNEAEQRQEITESRRILAEKTGSSIRSLAYPVGGMSHFNDTTITLTGKAGYELAFTHNTGITGPGQFHRHAIPRISAPGNWEYFLAVFHFPTLMGCGKKKRPVSQAGPSLHQETRNNICNGS